MYRACAAALTAAVLVASTLPAQAPRTVEVVGPPGNPITSAVGTFTIRALDFPAEDYPLRLRLQVGGSADMDEPVLADTTVDGDFAQIIIPRLLPGSGEIYWRATALTARAGAVPSPVTGPRVAPTHLRLVSPNNPSGQTISTRHPTFTWAASDIPNALPGWDFELVIEATATGHPVLIARTQSTSLTAPNPLESNASYRWRVSARFPATGETVQAASIGTFVILSADAPLATLLYQNFPNPFPSAGVDRTCFWFDLHVAGPVRLEIVDTRGQPVRRIVPGPDIGGQLPAGRYGRPSSGSNSGCDDRFSWDGRAAGGRRAPPGIYLVRLHAGGSVFTRNIVLRGDR